jgi:hypothetical protein
VSTATHAGGEPRPDFLARFLSAVPLLAIYFGLAALYAWQASRRPMPTIFTDEIELTQLARSIAETGEPARRGDPYGLATLVAYALAPAWWLGTTTASWAATKLILVLAMTATVFPAYGLARMVVPKWYALAAAGAAVAVPALAYSPIVVEEPFAYPLSTLALWLIARVVERPGWGRVAAALAACVAATLARTQLSVLVAVLVLGLLWCAWDSVRVQRWRAEWSTWDWVGAVTIVLGFVLAFSAVMSNYSTSWRNTTFLYKDRIFEHATWAVGALAIGIGILPLVIGVAALVRPKDEPRDPATRAFVVTSIAALAAFIWYAGIKGAYLSTVFATYVYERNVIYLGPILLTAMALALARGVGRTWVLAIAGAVTLYVVNAVPIVLQYPYYEAHGLALLAFANRELGWSEGDIDRAVLVLSLTAVAVAIVLRSVNRGSTTFAAIAGVVSVAVVGWSLTTQVYAAEGERMLSEQIADYIPQPYDWVDRATGGEDVVVLGQQITDPTGIWVTELFNRDVRKMWSLDGTAPGPGAILTPDLDRTDGSLTPNPESKYVLALNGVELQAPVVARRNDATLYRIDGGPIKLASAVTGVYSDGWMSDESSYTRYAVSADEPGFAVVKLTRIGWCPSPDLRQVAKATVRIGPVGIGPDKQPRIERVTDTQTFEVRDCNANGTTLSPPKEPWRMEITVSPTFVPIEIDPRRSDRRELGAVVSRAGFQPLFED